MHASQILNRRVTSNNLLSVYTGTRMPSVCEQSCDMCCQLIWTEISSAPTIAKNLVWMEIVFVSKHGLKMKA